MIPVINSQEDSDVQVDELVRKFMSKNQEADSGTIVYQADASITCTATSVRWVNDTSYTEDTAVPF